MEESELEEGEAMADEAGVDPDIYLDYIGEKIQAVLGHFQKDFEGTVSADNLGAKFGAYGSFLPSQQRSPSGLSQPKSPTNSASYNPPRPPSDPQCEGARPSTTAPTNLATSSKSKCIPAVHPSDDPGNTNVCKTEGGALASGLQQEPCNRLTDGNDSKSLKVRIKVTENALGQKNAAIYSGLGLDISPSSSPEESPDGGEFSPGNQDAIAESPSTVFEFYERFQAARLVTHLLSPTGESFFHMKERRTPYRKDVKQEGALHPKSAKEPPKSCKSFEKTPKAPKHEVGSDVSANSKEGIDIEIPAGKRLVPDVLNARLLSTATRDKAQKLAKEPAKGAGLCKTSGETMGKVRTVLPDLVEEDPLNTTVAQTLGSKFEVLQLKAKAVQVPSSALKATQEVKMVTVSDEATADLEKTEQDTAYRIVDLVKNDSDLRGRSDVCPTEPVKLKAPKKSPPLEQEMEKALPGMDKSSGAKRKANSNQPNGAYTRDAAQETTDAMPIVRSKEKKKSTESKVESGSKSHHFKSHENPIKICKMETNTTDAWLSFVGQGDDQDNAQKMSSNMLEDCKFGSSDDAPFTEKLKDKDGTKRHENLLAREASDKVVEAASVIHNPLAPDMISQQPAPVVIEEQWVCCDRCQKWRLLPYGTEPKHLPKKWTCILLDWLPGMNKCSIDQEKTTEALRALYQPPAPDAQVARNGQNDVAYSGITFVDPHRVPQNDITHHNMSTSITKKNLWKDGSNTANQLAASQPTNSAKGMCSISAKSRNQSDADEYALGKISSQHKSKTTGFVTEKRKNKSKEKEPLDLQSNGGNMIEQEGKRSKMNNMKVFPQDGSRALKKPKSKDSRDEHEHFNHVVDGDVDLDTNGAKLLVKNAMKEDTLPLDGSTHRHKDGLTHGKKVNAMKSARVEKNEHFSSLEIDKLDLPKKRNMEDLQKSQILHVGVAHDTLEETGDTVIRNVKKVKTSNCEGRELNASKMDGKEERSLYKCSQASRDHLVNETRENKGADNLLEQSERDPDGADLKRDLYISQHSTAATSSSSKVSGSRRSKANFLEARSSPVESVSSSPLRSSSFDKLSISRSSKIKDDKLNIVYSNGDPKRGSEDDLYEYFKTKEKEKSIPVVHARLPERKVDVEMRALDSNISERGGNSQRREVSHAQLSVGKAKDMLFKKIFGGIDDEPLPSEREDVNTDIDASLTNEEPNVHSNDSHLKDDSDHLELHKQHEYKGHNSQRKVGKSSSRYTEKQRNYKTEIKNGKTRASNLSSDLEDLHPEKNSDHSKLGTEIATSDIDLMNNELKIYSAKGGNRSIDGKKDNRPSSGMQANGDVTGIPVPAKRHSDSSRLEDNMVAFKSTGKSHSQGNTWVRREEKCPRRSPSHRLDKVDTLFGKGKPDSLNFKDINEEPQNRDNHAGSVPFQGSQGLASVEATNGDAADAPKHGKKVDNSLRNPTPNGVDATITQRKDAGQSTAYLLKEARDLKHTANRLKSEGSVYESTGLYFQAALKFLHWASLTESAKHGDNSSSSQMYSETAKLCEFCAHEYEKHRESAAAALAYKCMEVAYMKVVYSKNFAAIKDRHDLLNAPLIGESPSSSASDIDNLNNHAMMEKGAVGKAVKSPQVAGNHIIAARNRLNFARILGFVEDVNAAMEASRKSLNAFAAASACQQDVQYTEGIASVRRVLDFSFHDVEGLLRLVRLSMEAIGR